MRVTVKIAPEGLTSSKAFALAVVDLLAPIVAINRRLLALQLVPPLYASGVRYAGEEVETFVDALTCHRARRGDCAHLSAWRVAELRNAGEPATLRLKWQTRSSGGKLYHVQVRRADGRIEDPSRLLGMR